MFHIFATFLYCRFVVVAATKHAGIRVNYEG